MSRKTLEGRGRRLPAELTSFIGRQRELAQIRRSFEQGRLVTLMGPAGVGKTRLAVRAAAEMQRTFEDGVYFVDLAALREPALLAATVCDALGLSGQGVDPVDAFVEHVADRSLLLVMDTCDHLVDVCAMLAEVLLQAAPRLRILATSRQPFDIPGEHTLAVAPLARPGTARPADTCDSMLLFADRAAAVTAGWTLTPDNRGAVARLCDRLDGIPLAIELAAVQVRALPVEQILHRLDERILRLRGRRTGSARHRTLHAAVEWSHELCSPAERLLWARLSTFAGDFDLEGAERVCADDLLPQDEVVEVLAGLIGKSIVLRSGRGAEARYRMLDTVREYGAEQLERLDETHLLRTRAMHWFGGQIIAAQPELTTGAQVRWMDWFRREHANIRAVIDHTLRTADDDFMVALTWGLGQFWAIHGLVREARHWSERFLRTRDTSDPKWAGPLAVCSLAAIVQNDLDRARTVLSTAEARARSADDATALAYVRGMYGLIAVYTEDLAAARLLLSASAEAAEADESVHGETSLLSLAIDLFRGLALVLDGDLEEGSRQAAAMVRAAEARGELWCRSYAQIEGALATALGGDVAGALATLHQALRIKWDLDDLMGLATALECIGGCLVALEEPRRAARVLGAAAEARDASGAAMFGPQYAQLCAHYADTCRAALGDETYRREHDAGAALGLEAVVREILGEEGPDRPEPSDTATPPDHPLTARELEIAALVAQGLTNREIAERLVIARRTAESHLEHILAKLGFASRIQVATWFSRHFVEPSPDVPPRPGAHGH
ncbi:ATP-binding protein [Thermomonospora umbrina]|uniref:Putative ATPase n=1 Tax=Thermomonospora umbrina TaxID=111806 RepID=A0A3D9SR16_9ACTN|nr:LuxR C-terminal-related transcriptional regulator [Thermomonospora umbrina]REE96383.1 putative ATPase [Thermomonospora umbrina]